MKSMSWLFMASLVAGCTAGPKLAPIDAQHPASPDAPEAMVSEPGVMLREPIAPMSEAESSTPQHHGHGMHGGSTAAKPSAEAGGADAQQHGNYTCPKHPEVRQSTPGRCPKCGMNLVHDRSERDAEGR